MSYFMMRGDNRERFADFPHPGDIVRFTGTPASASDYVYAMERLEVGSLYEVERCEVGGSWSHMNLVGVPGGLFNCILFEIEKRS